MNGKEIMCGEGGTNGTFAVQVPDTLSEGFTCNIIHVTGGTTTVSVAATGSMNLVGDLSQLPPTSMRNISVYGVNKAAAT